MIISQRLSEVWSAVWSKSNELKNRPRHAWRLYEHPIPLRKIIVPRCLVSYVEGLCRGSSCYFSKRSAKSALYHEPPHQEWGPSELMAVLWMATCDSFWFTLLDSTGRDARGKKRNKKRAKERKQWQSKAIKEDHGGASDPCGLSSPTGLRPRRRLYIQPGRAGVKPETSTLSVAPDSVCSTLLTANSELLHSCRWA